MLVKLAEDYSDTPGARYISDGTFSGEDFRDNFLDSKLTQSLESEEKLYIDLDGGYGYSSDFLEEAFGGLIRKGYKLADIMRCVEIISKEDPILIDDIKRYVIDAHILQREEKSKSLTLK